MLKPRKNKTFNYQSVFSKENELDGHLDESKKRDFISKWKTDREGSRKVRGVMPILTLFIVLVLLLICMYLLEKNYM